MRRTDVLFRNVVEDAVRLDKKENLALRPRAVSKNFMSPSTNISSVTLFH
jgi:hypothetical protein